MTLAPLGSSSPGHGASGSLGANNQATSAIVLCDAALTNSKLAKLCQRGTLFLPVANRPVIQYILDTLVRSGIRKVTFAGTDEVSCDAISMYLTSASGSPAQKNVSLNVVCDPGSVKSSVNLIRHVLASEHAQHDLSVAHENHGNHEDVLVVSSLFVSPLDVSLQGQLLYHKVKRAGVTMMLCPAVEDENGEYTTREYVAVRPDGVMAAYCPTGTAKGGDVKIPAVSLLSPHGERLRVQKDLMDMRVYVFNREMLSQVLQEKEGLLDVQKHLIPYFVRKTALMSAPRPECSDINSGQRGMDRMSSSNLSGSGGETDRGAGGFGGAGVDGDDGLKHRTAVHAYVRSRDTSSMKSIRSASDGTNAGTTSSADMIMIVDSETSYANVNREILKCLERSDIAQGVTMGAKAAVGNGSIVGAESSLGDKASVKRSVVGPNCIIGANTKIINCIIHEGVRLGDGCHIQNSILCRGVTLDAKTSLKDCLIGPNQTIFGNHKGEEFFSDD